MKCFVRITVLAVLIALGTITVYRSLGLDGLLGQVGQFALIVVTMLLISLSDPELFWGAQSKRHR